MFKVMLVEDEMLVRLGLKNSIAWDTYDMIVAAEATDGEAAWRTYLEDVEGSAELVAERLAAKGD